jgi:DNA invertase Pin-like site-specific DNA recombinase
MPHRIGPRDTLVIWKLGKLSHGLRHLVNTVGELIVEPTMVGIAAAKARGKQCARRPMLTPKEIRLLHKAMGERRKLVVDVIAEFGLSRATVCLYVSPNG